MTTTKPQLVLEEATHADADELAPLFAAAFHDGDDIAAKYFQKMCPLNDATTDGWIKSTHFGLDDPYTIFLKVTDKNTGKIVAYGRWLKPKKDEDKDQPGNEEGRWDDVAAVCDEETANALFGAFHQNRHEMMGDRKHYCKFTIPWKLHDCKMIIKFATR